MPPFRPLPASLLSALFLLGTLGLQLLYLETLGHLGSQELPSELFLPLLALMSFAVLCGWGIALFRLVPELRRAAVPPEEARAQWLRLPRQAALGLALGWLAGGLIMAGLLGCRGVSLTVGLHLLVSLTLVPAGLAGAASFFLFEEAARAHIARALPGGTLARIQLRLRTRLLLLLVGFPLVTTLALGVAFAHVLERHEPPLPHGHEAQPTRSHPAAIASTTHGSLVDPQTGVYLLSLVTALLGIGLGLSAARSLSRPIVWLTEAMERVRAGDLRVRVPVVSEDELGRAAETFNGMAQGLAEREWLHETFGRYVSREVAEALLQGRITLEGEEREVTVLFADIRGFTQLSEALAPSEVLAFVNAYLQVMTQAVVQHGGRLDKVMGDGMMAVFGAPLADAAHARHAVLAALEMRGALELFNAGRAAKGQPPIRIGMGLHSGTVTAGNVGWASHKLEYTVLGDTVNLASRIEGLTKEFGVDLLASEATVLAAGAGVRARVMPEVQVKGKSAPVRTFAVDSCEAAPPASSPSRPAAKPGT
jgi:class 3 adenylate cyclase